LSRDPLEHKFSWTSTYCYASNNPIIYTDPTGASIVYPGNAQQQANAMALVAAATKNNPDGTINPNAAVLKKLEESDVVFSILVGSQAELGTHTGSTEVDKGGATGYNFNSNQVVIGIENVNSSPIVQLAAMGDELKTGEQFLDKKIGFATISNESGTSNGAFGNDARDEVDTKYASMYALIANGYTSKDLLTANQKIEETNSPLIISYCEKGQWLKGLNAVINSAYGKELKLKDESLDGSKLTLERNYRKKDIQQAAYRETNKGVTTTTVYKKPAEPSSPSGGQGKKGKK
jgi:hypothetical protein